MCDADNGLYTFDFTNPNSPQQISYLPLPRKPEGIATYQGYLYVDNGRSLYIFDPNDLSLLSQMLFPDVVTGICTYQKGNYVYIYVANEDAGFCVLRHKKCFRKNILRRVKSIDKTQSNP